MPHDYVPTYNNGVNLCQFKKCKCWSAREELSASAWGDRTAIFKKSALSEASILIMALTENRVMQQSQWDPAPLPSPITGQSTNYTNWEPNYFCLPHAPPRIIHQCPFPTLCSLLLSCTKFQRLISLTNSVFQVPRFFLIKTNYYNFILIIFIKSTVCKTYNIFGKNCLLASTALL